MQPEEKLKLLKYLQDALSAAQTIELGTTGLSVQNYYFNNIKWIVERGIEIISESLRRASSIEPDLLITDIHKIYATRNRIAHEYDIVDPNQLYNIVNKNIPVLISELKKIITKIETE
jgi:uncharacterized protein with HEPN domain